MAQGRVARGFAGGALWGAALGIVGLVLLSQLAPLPEGTGQGAPQVTAETASPVAPEGTAAEVEGGGPTAEAGGAAAPAEAAAADAVAEAAPGQDAPATDGAAPDTFAGAGESPASPAPEVQGEAASAPASADAAPDTSATTAKAEDAESLPATTEASPAPAEAASDPAEAAAPTGTETASQAPAPQSAEPMAPSPAPAVQSAEPVPATPPGLPAEMAPPPSLAALDEALKAPGPAEPDPLAASPPAQPPQTGPTDGLLQPGTDLRMTSRLPQISTESDPALAPQGLPALEAPPQAPATPLAPPPPDAEQRQAALPEILTPDAQGLPGRQAGALPEARAEADLPQIGDDPARQEPPAPAVEASGAPALVRHARPFDGGAGKPLFAILLRDVGAAGVPVADLAKLPFPVSLVIDPLSEGASAAAQTWRAAGQEVVMLGTGIPPEARAEDVAQSFETLANLLPEAVAVIDPSQAGFQDDRALSTLVLEEIATQGRGLLTWDRGLNAADQIARRDGLPSAVVYRVLDGAGESQPVMRRYLDRAAFKAGQDGAVVVIGDTRAATVEAILAWALEGKGATVALAPISAVLLAPR